MQETIYVGLDLGSSHCCQSIIGADGSPGFSRLVRTSEQHLRDAFAGLGGDVRVHMEAGELADWASSVIAPVVSRVVVSHPRSLAWIGKDWVKDDKVDAGKLAELLRIGRVHEVYREEDAKKRCYEQSLENTKNQVHARLATQRKILGCLRSMWIANQPYRDFGG